MPMAASTKLAGLGFVLVTADESLVKGLDELTSAALEFLRMKCVTLATQPGEGTYRDLDSRLKPFMEKQGWDTMIVRPDFYVYGGACGTSESNALIEDLLSDLANAGVTLPHGVAVQSR